MDQFIRFREDRDRMYEDVDLSPRPASQSRTTICVVMEIEHANNAGYVHGGTIMRLVDTAAGIAAARHARRRTRYRFHSGSNPHSRPWIGHGDRQDAVTASGLNQAVLI